jgi:hypothetical protein
MIVYTFMDYVVVYIVSTWRDWSFGPVRFSPARVRGCSLLFLFEIMVEQIELGKLCGPVILH